MADWKTPYASKGGGVEPASAPQGAPEDEGVPPDDDDVPPHDEAPLEEDDDPPQDEGGAQVLLLPVDEPVDPELQLARIAPAQLAASTHSGDRRAQRERECTAFRPLSGALGSIAAHFSNACAPVIAPRE
jgi:hypothetical protein